MIFSFLFLFLNHYFEDELNVDIEPIKTIYERAYFVCYCLYNILVSVKSLKFCIKIFYQSMVGQFVRNVSYQLVVLRILLFKCCFMLYIQLVVCLFLTDSINLTLYQNR